MESNEEASNSGSKKLDLSLVGSEVMNQLDLAFSDSNIKKIISLNNNSESG